MSLRRAARTLALASAAFLSGYFAGGGFPVGRTSPAADTLVVRSVRVDTVKVTKPIYIERRVTETISVPVSDTVTLHDTVFVRLPMEERVYSDSLYRARVSGYRPSLDWIEVYPRTVTVTRAVRAEPPKWSFGVQAGFGATKDGLTPYIGVGVQRALFPF